MKEKEPHFETLMSHPEKLLFAYSRSHRMSGRDLGFVYLIAEEGSEFVKIGFTATWPLSRHEAMQTANPRPLKVVGYMPGTMADENSLHIKFKEYHVRGEWFRMADEMRSVFDQYRDSGIPDRYAVEPGGTDRKSPVLGSHRVPASVKAIRRNPDLAPHSADAKAFVEWLIKIGMAGVWQQEDLLADYLEVCVVAGFQSMTIREFGPALDAIGCKRWQEDRRKVGQDGSRSMVVRIPSDASELSAIAIPVPPESKRFKRMKRKLKRDRNDQQKSIVLRASGGPPKTGMPWPELERGPGIQNGNAYAAIKKNGGSFSALVKAA
jgi:hypothetical protein